jgi:hypothetical protein
MIEALDRPRRRGDRARECRAGRGASRAFRRGRPSRYRPGNGRAGASKRSDAARIRVNVLSDWTRQRIGPLSEIRSGSSPSYRKHKVFRTPSDWHEACSLVPPPLQRRANCQSQELQGRAPPPRSCRSITSASKRDRSVVLLSPEPGKDRKAGSIRRQGPRPRALRSSTSSLARPGSLPSMLIGAGHGSKLGRRRHQDDLRWHHSRSPTPRPAGPILELRNDPDLSAAMAAELASENGRHLNQVLGREPTAADLSLAHFLGAGRSKPGSSPQWRRAGSLGRAVVPRGGRLPTASVFMTGAELRLASGRIHARFEQRQIEKAPVGEPPRLSRPWLPGNRSGARAVHRPSPKGFATSNRCQGRLSLSFAQAAYRRLSALGDGA